MQTTLRTTLNCQACVRKVTPGLNRIDGLSDWSVDTDDPEKRLTVAVDGPEVLESVMRVVREAGFESSLETEAATKANRGAGPADGAPAETPERSGDEPAATTSLATVPWSTYWPLFLVLLYIIGGTLLLQQGSAGWSWHLAMNSFMGLFFVGFAFFKLLDVPKFADAFASYDLIAARSRVYGLAYPFIELGLGSAYLLGLLPTLTNSLTIVVMGVGLIGVVRAVRSGRAIRCACLGTAFNLPMSSVTIIENSSMVLMAAAMLAWSTGS
jgi:cation transport ATPase